MKLANTTGTVLCLRNGAVEVLNYKPGIYPKTFLFETTSGRWLGDDLEYDYHFDAYTHQSDDGEEFYNVIRVIGTDLTQTVETPTEDELKSVAVSLLPKIFDAVSNQEMHKDDMSFAMNILRNISFVHQAWEQKGKDLSVACDSLLKSIFKNHGYR